jgi:hypothetical protein
MSYAEGIKGENFFASLMSQNGLRFTFVDDWFDYEVNGQKVEIKTAQLTVSNGGHRQAGIYQFTSEENRYLQYKNNVWVCFIVQHEGQFMVQGFCKSRQLEQKKYISVIAASRLKLRSLQSFINTINK